VKKVMPRNLSGEPRAVTEDAEFQDTKAVGKSQV
jgi:hypothetical protein